MAQGAPRPKRQHNVQVRLNDREKAMLDWIAKTKQLSEAEAARVAIRFYAEYPPPPENWAEITRQAGIRRGDARTQGTKRNA